MGEAKAFECLVADTPVGFEHMKDESIDYLFYDCGVMVTHLKKVLTIERSSCAYKNMVAERKRKTE